MTAFSVPVVQGYARELAQKLTRCPMNEQARRSEVRDFARLVVECYRVEKMKDWVPAKTPGAGAPEGVLNIEGGN
jgi:hypothetical protein